MNKDKMVKVRLLNDGGFSELKHLSFPMDVDAKISERGKGIDVHQSQFGLISTTETELVFFSKREYELITEEEPAPQKPTIEQLLEELAQVNADGLALANRKNELLGILNPRLNPYGYKLED